MKKKNEVTVESLDERQRAIEEAQAIKAKKEQDRIAHAKRVKAAFNKMANTEAGRIVFRQIAEWCGHNKSSIVVDPVTTEIITKNVEYNEARRNLYFNIRNQIRDKHLVKIEFNLEAARNED